MKTLLINSQIVTFNPKGCIMAANVKDFQSILSQQILTQNYAVFVLDMSEVRFLDSAGLMAIVKAFKLVQELGKRFVICSITEPVKLVFELVKLDNLIEIYRDYGEVEDSLYFQLSGAA